MATEQELLERLPSTPMWLQYSAVKAKAPDALLFYRMGDFYELFLDDAVVAAELLNITLTARHKDIENPVPMCGVPFHSATAYINKLLSFGRRVAICEQVEEPGQTKGIVKRDIVRVVSPGMIYDADSIASDEANFLASIFVDKANCTAIASNAICGAISFVELSTGAVYTAEFRSWTEWENLFAVYMPKEIFIPEWLHQSQAWKTIEKELPYLSQICVTTLASYFYDPSDCYGDLCAHFGVRDLTSFGLEKAAPTTFAFGAAFRKIRETQGNADLKHLRPPVAYDRSDFLQLDTATIDHLDILPKADRNPNESLFHHLNRTKTAMGARQLKQWLMRPLQSLEKIQARQDAIQSLVSIPTFLDSLRDKLQGVRDLERLMGKVGTHSASPRDLISLQLTLERIPYIRACLRQFKNAPLLQQLHTEILEFVELCSLLETRLLSEAPTHAREGNIFRSGWHSELTELIDLCSNGRQTIAKMELSERERSGITNLKIKYNRVFGYFIEVTKANVKNVPQNYIRKQTMTNAERYITADLKEFEEKILKAEERRIRLEAALFEELLVELSKHAQAILNTASILAEVDALQALAFAAIQNNYIRPKMHSGIAIDIQGGRHPVIERLLGESNYIANTLTFDENERLWLITGPNMAGKSTFMRQSAILVLLAHVGAYIPAENASIGLVDRIASRVGASDRIGRGQSTFMVEMSEMARIIHTATERSLLIIDEIGRGTSTFDGLAIAWSIIESIHDSIQARTLFATHYHELTELAGSMQNLHNLHVEVQKQNGAIAFLHSVKPGKASGSYGIEVAKLAGLPKTILNRATKILSDLEADPKHKRKLKQSLANSQQLSFFASDLHSEPYSNAENDTVPEHLDTIAKELLAFDINSCTPLEALLKIKSLKDVATRPSDARLN